MVRQRVLLEHIICLTLFFQLGKASSKRDFVIVLPALECRSYAPSVVEFDCDLQQHGNRSYFSGRILFKKTVEEMKTRIIIKPMLAFMSQLNNFDTTSDVCKLLKEAPKHYLWKVAFNSIKKKVNEMPKACPLKTNFNFTLTDGFINEEAIPSYAPEGKYSFEWLSYMNEKMVLNTTGQFDVVYLKKRFGVK